MRAHGESLPGTSKLGFETLPRKLRALGVSPCLRPCTPGVNPFLYELGSGVNQSLPRTHRVRCESLPTTLWTRM